LRQHVSSSAPYVQPSDSEDVPVTIVHIGVNATQTTRIMGNLGDKYELTLITFLQDNVDVFAWQPS
jgi:hypothetical protein